MTPRTRLAIWLAIALCHRASDDAIELGRHGHLSAREVNKRCSRCHRDLQNIAALLVELRG